MNSSRTKLLVAAGVTLAAIYGAAVVATDGEPLLAVPPVAGIFLIALFARPVIGLYLLLSAAVLFEQWGVQGLDPVTANTHFFDNISSYTSFDLRLSLAELLVILSLVAAALNQAYGVSRWRGGPLGFPVAAYGATFAVGMAVGFTRGNWSDSAALAEFRGPFLLVATYFLAANLIRTREHVVRLAILFVALVGAKSLEAMANTYAMFDRGLRLDAVSSHEDVIFFATVLMLAPAAIVLLGRSRVTYALIAIVPPIAITELLNQRRVGFIALLAVMLVVALALLGIRRDRVLMLLVPSMMCAVAYGAVFWNSEGTLAQPIRAIRAIVAPDSISERDRLSNLWRDIENANIAFTLREAPVTGVGLGQQYFFQVEPPPLTGFTYWRYMTHNAIFWVWLKAGLLGFAAFWLLGAKTIVASTRLVQQLSDPELALVALIPLALIVAQMVFSAVDLGLTYSRCMIVLGLGLGLVPALAATARPVERIASRARYSVGPAALQRVAARS